MNKNILLPVSIFFLIACSDTDNTKTEISNETQENRMPTKKVANEPLLITDISKPAINTLRTFSLSDEAVVLTITGKISQFNKAKSLLLNRQNLLSFPQTTIATSTIWSDGVNNFKGPLVRDVLGAAGNSAAFISATAINEYTIEIPVEDSKKYPVIFALEHNGKPLSIREKGPVWIIYPWSTVPELNHDKYYSRSIWQLNRIHLHD